MKRLALLIAVSVSAAAFGQQIRIDLPLPTISFPAPPPLVVVTPGVQVVPDYEEEVFFVDNWYWCRRGPTWYRTRTHGGGWAVVEAPLVPPTLVRLPPGHYRHYKGPKAPRAAAVVAPVRMVPVGPGPGNHGNGRGKHKH